MRTTLDIDDHVLRQAKQLAAREGKTLTRVVEEALRERVVRPRRGARPFRLHLLTKKGRLDPRRESGGRPLVPFVPGAAGLTALPPARG